MTAKKKNPFSNDFEVDKVQLTDIVIQLSHRALRLYVYILWEINVNTDDYSTIWLKDADLLFHNIRTKQDAIRELVSINFIDLFVTNEYWINKPYFTWKP